MRYKRRFKLQAAHFNSDWSYKRVWATAITAADARQLLTHIHGHNFTIDVVLDGSFGVGRPAAWLVDDVELSNVVMEWDNTNLSMHVDFLDDKVRATTENMARILFGKLLIKFGPIAKSVTVYETDQICATAGDFP